MAAIVKLASAAIIAVAVMAAAIAVGRHPSGTSFLA